MTRFLGWVLAFALHANDGNEITDHLVPKTWKGNPWGPTANRARELGDLPPIEMTPLMRQWDTWGRTVVKDGDVLFRRGEARMLFGLFPVSRFIANCSGSKFSHTGIAVWEEGGLFVYDTTRGGVRRQPFHVWVLDNTGPFGVKRLKAEQRGHIAGAIQYCRDVYRKQVPWDRLLKPDDSALYCVEMTEKAYRSSGLTLSEPLPLGDMENAAQFPICMFCIAYLTPLKLDQPLYFPGNERHGLWSSPLLEQVYPPPPTRSAANPARPRRAS